ncbi:hypothetical protein FRB91_003173 [Serendipita sp. 411]|nr:hypothetical protein FRC19_007576 [Serendipita sp. 401]KAG8843698.1 hypothetical protein FRB91_003173 [Serendipita sp. 411]
MTYRQDLNTLKSTIPQLRPRAVEYPDLEHDNTVGNHQLWRCRCKIQDTDLVTDFSEWCLNIPAAEERAARLMIDLINRTPF